MRVKSKVVPTPGTLIQGIMKLASKMTPLERQKYFRSFGKTKKEGIHTAIIGKSGEDPGLYYNPNLPFIETYQYFRKPSATARAIAKEKGHTLKDEYPETRSRFIQPKEEDPFIMAQMTGTADEGWRHKYVKVRQSEANWNDKAKKWILPLSKDSIRNPNRAKRIQEVVNDVSDNPEKHGLKLDPTKKIRIPYGSYVTAVNKVLNNEGYKDIPASSIKNAIVAKQGTSIVQLRGTDTEKKLHKFLKTTDPETKRPYYETITASELRKKLPWLTSDNSAINASRKAAGLQRTNIGKSEGDKVEARVIEATRKVRQKVKKEHSYLSDDEVDAMMEQARIMLGNLKPGYKKGYPDKTINAVYNFIEDTEILNRGMDPYYNSYIAEKALNRLRTALTGETHTIGHARKEAADTWWFPGYETPMISPQRWDMNLKQRGVDTQFQAAIKRGDMATAMIAYKKMLKMGMRSSMVDDYGEQIFYGAPAKKGKLAEGGLINDPLTAMMSSGGFMDYGEMKPVVPPLDPGERQHLVKGGKGKGPIPTPGTAVQYIKRQVLPKVIGHTTKIMEKLAAPKDATKVVPKPWAVVDRDGLPIKDFKTEKDANKWLYDKKETVPENEYYESTIDYSVKPVEQIKAAPVVEETPAMMWKAPEIIANAPMEIAQGKQWYGILKKAGVSPKELDDTSLGPFLDIQQPNTKFTKKQLLEEFDNLAPKIEVLTTGKRDQGKYLTNILKKFNNVRDSISDFSGKDQAVLNNFAGILQKVNAAKTDKQLSVLANQTNKIMKQSYGIDNALMSDQIPTTRQIPAPIRSIFGDMQELFKTRGAAHAFDKKPSHTGDQTLPGGVNYREYMFKYTPNALRFTEPTYTPGHSFNFSDEVAKNTFVHARISDRTDNFGRKLLFVEEIQSDMHQKPQKAIRSGQPSGYATRKDKILSAQTYIDEMAVLQNKIDAILAREPNHASLPALYKQRGTLAAKIEKIRGEVSGGGSIPEGPFQRSEDYGSFVMKYLLRLAKEGNYDGVAVSTGNIKNRRGYGSEEETKGHYGFYDKIMQKVMKKIAKNADLEYNRTVINDGAVNWGNVPILILKEIDKVMKGLPSFREGGLNRENFVDVVPLL